MDNILVIDDDHCVLDSFRGYLQYVGYEVTTACSGEEGITLISNGYEYDLVITDIRMPGVNGNELAKHIRGSNQSHVPIIAITGFHNDVDQDLFDIILQKPFDLKVLVKTIKMLIKKMQSPSMAIETSRQNGNSNRSITQ